MSDSLNNPFGDISLILTQNGDNISCSYANAISETLDTLANKQKSSNEDPSNINGDYHLGNPNIKCGGWLPKFENNDVLQNVLRDNTTEKSRFFTSKTLLNLIEAYSKSNKMTVINMGLKNNMASSSIMSNYPPFDQRFLPLQIPTPQVLGLLEANSLPKNHEQFNLNRCSMNFSVNNAGNDIIKDILEPATGEGCSK